MRCPRPHTERRSIRACVFTVPASPGLNFFVTLPGRKASSYNNNTDKDVSGALEAHLPGWPSIDTARLRHGADPVAIGDEFLACTRAWGKMGSSSGGTGLVGDPYPRAKVECSHFWLV